MQKWAQGMHSFPAAMANGRVERGWILGAINSPWAWERAQRDQRIHLLLMIPASVATPSLLLSVFLSAVMLSSCPSVPILEFPCGNQTYSSV